MQVSAGRESGSLETEAIWALPKNAWPESVVVAVVPIVVLLVSVMLPTGKLGSISGWSGHGFPLGATGIVTKLLTTFPISTATGAKQPVIPAGTTKLI